MTEPENPSSLHRITTVGDLERGLKKLRDIDPAMTAIIDDLPEIALRNRAPGFAGLAEIVVSQQVSKVAAAAMMDRLRRSVDPLEPQCLLAAGEKPLIDAGLSRAKQATLTGLATKLASGELDLESLSMMPVEDARVALTALKGVGPWTADVFLLFCAAHPDIFPAGDIALQHAAGWVTGSENRPSIAETDTIAQRWKPLRSIAARVLYAFYAQQRGRSALPV